MASKLGVTLNQVNLIERHPELARHVLENVVTVAHHLAVFYEFKRFVSGLGADCQLAALADVSKRPALGEREGRHGERERNAPCHGEKFASVERDHGIPRETLRSVGEGNVGSQKSFEKPFFR